MLNQLNKQILEAETDHNLAKIAYYNKQLEIFNNSKTLGEVKIKSNASNEFKKYLSTKTFLDFLKRQFEIAKIDSIN
jgi:hypothetical protein